MCVYVYILMCIYIYIYTIPLFIIEYLVYIYIYIHTYIHYIIISNTHISIYIIEYQGWSQTCGSHFPHLSLVSSGPAQAAPAGPTGQALDAAEFDLRFGRGPAVEGVEGHLNRNPKFIGIRSLILEGYVMITMIMINHRITIKSD